MSTFCAACPIDKGLCPQCGTFWVPAAAAGKRYGVRPVDGNAWVASGGDTRHPGVLNNWPNVVTDEARS